MVGAWVAERVGGLVDRRAGGVAGAVMGIVQRWRERRKRIRVAPLSEEWLRRHAVESAKHRSDA